MTRITSGLHCGGAHSRRGYVFTLYPRSIVCIFVLEHDTFILMAGSSVKITSCIFARPQHSFSSWHSHS